MARISFGKRVDNISMLLLSLLVFLLSSQQVVGAGSTQNIGACGDVTAGADVLTIVLTADLYYNVSAGCLHMTDSPTTIEVVGNGHKVYGNIDLNYTEFINMKTFLRMDWDILETLSIDNVKFYNFGVLYSFFDPQEAADTLQFKSLSVENCEFHNSFGAAVVFVQAFTGENSFFTQNLTYTYTVRNNKLINHPASSAAFVVVGTHKSVVVENNVIQFNGSNSYDIDFELFGDFAGAIMFMGAGNHTVNNNHFSGSSRLAGIAGLTYAINGYSVTSVSHNTFRNVRVTAAILVKTEAMSPSEGLYDELTAAGLAPRTTVSSNIIENSMSDGVVINLDCETGLYVYNNTIKNVTTKGDSTKTFQNMGPIGGGILSSTDSEFECIIEKNTIDGLRLLNSCADILGLGVYDSFMTEIFDNKILNLISDDSCVQFGEPEWQNTKRAVSSKKLKTAEFRDQKLNKVAKKPTAGSRDSASKAVASKLEAKMKKEKKSWSSDAFTVKGVEAAWKKNSARAGYFYDEFMTGIYVVGIYYFNVTKNTINNVVSGSMQSDSDYERGAFGFSAMHARGDVVDLQVSKIIGATRPTCTGCEENDGTWAVALWTIDASVHFKNVKIDEITGGKGGNIRGATGDRTTSYGGDGIGIYDVCENNEYEGVSMTNVLSGKNGFINGVDPCKNQDYPFGITSAYFSEWRYENDEFWDLPEGIITDGANNSCYRYKRPIVHKALIIKTTTAQRAALATYIIDVWGENFGLGYPGELQAWISGYKCSKADWHSETYFTCTLHGRISGTNLPVLVTVRQLSNDRLYTAVVDFPEVTPVGLPTCIPPFGAQDPLNPEICNCFSGHAPSSQLATDCSVDAKCPGKIVSFSTLDHHASRPKISFSNDRLTITQTTPIVKGRRDTHIKLVGIDGVTESTETCNFPGPIWTKSLSALDCLDIYTGVIPWSQNGMCGFQKVIGGDATKFIYSANLVMTYRDIMSLPGKEPSFRMSSESHVITVEFARQLTVALSSTALISVVQEESQIDLEVTSSALYDPATKETFVTFRTTANSPYKLSTMIAEWTPSYTPTDPDFGYPHVTAVLSSQAGDAECGGVPEVCEQDWVLTIVTFIEGSQTCNLKGTITLVPGPLMCRDLSPDYLCESTGDVANLTITVSDDTDLCEGSDDEVDASKNVDSFVSTYSDDVYVSQQDSFQVGDMCYVQIAVRSPQATLDSILFNQVTIGETDESLYRIEPSVVTNEDASFNITHEKINDGSLISPNDIAILTFQFRLSRRLISLSTLGGETDSIALEIKVVLDLKFHGNTEEIVEVTTQLPDRKRSVSGSNYFQSSAKHAIMLTLPEAGYGEQSKYNDEEDNAFGDELSGDASVVKLSLLSLFALFAVVCASLVL